MNRCFRACARCALVAVHALAVLAVLASAPRADALTILTSTDQGHYTNDLDSTDAVTHTSANYLTGRVTGNQHRSYFVFDVGAGTGPLESAVLRLQLGDGGYDSRDVIGGVLDETETFGVFEVTTAAATVTSGATGAAGVPIWSDLGEGAELGFRVLSAADEGGTIDIQLDPAALAAANGLLVLGGAVTSFDPTSLQFSIGIEAVFASAPYPKAQLVLTELPEPGAALLLVLAAGATPFIRRQLSG